MRARAIRVPLVSERKRSLERKGWDGEPPCKSPLSRAPTSHPESCSSRGLLPEKPEATGFFAAGQQDVAGQHRPLSQAPRRARRWFLHSARHGGTMDQGRQERAEVDAAVLLLLCRTNAVRFRLHARAHNLANFLRMLALPKMVAHWSLTGLSKKLVKIGAKIATRARHVVFPDGRCRSAISCWPAEKACCLRRLRQQPS